MNIISDQPHIKQDTCSWSWLRWHHSDAPTVHLWDLCLSPPLRVVLVIHDDTYCSLPALLVFLACQPQYWAHSTYGSKFIISDFRFHIGQTSDQNHVACILYLFFVSVLVEISLCNDPPICPRIWREYLCTYYVVTSDLVRVELGG